MILSEHLNNFEQGLINEKKTTDNFDKSNPVYKSLVEHTGKVNTKLCKTSLDKTALYEFALKEALHNEFPDKHWSEITGCDIRATLLESGNDLDKTARRIVESLKVKQEKETVKKETGALKENMRKKSLKENWYYFSYLSGGNPYIAKDEKERDRILKKYKGRVEEVKPGFYEIDDIYDYSWKSIKRKQEDESLKESAEWKYTLSCSDDLESAIDSGDLEEVVETLKGAYDELVDQELLDEGRRDKVVSSLEQIDVYDDGAEAMIEKKLDQFYNVCDKLGVKISFNESLKEDWYHFSYTSGSNPYIAKNEKERDRILKKYKGKVKEIKKGFYEIDDKSNVEPFVVEDESLKEGVSKKEVIDAIIANHGCSKKEAEKQFKEMSDERKELLVQGFKENAKKSFLTDSLEEDTVKQGSSWVNKGKEGTHGKFKTKKGADAQRKAMFANGYKEGLTEGRFDYRTYPLYEYEFTDGLFVIAPDEEEAVAKHDDIIQNMHKGSPRSKEELDKIANDLYDNHDEHSFNYFSDEELAILWSMCMTTPDNHWGRAYDDEVYEAMSNRATKKDILELANKYLDNPTNEALTEAPIYDLTPQYDSRQSFYSKAKVDTGEKGDKNKLYSYNTLVAEIKDGKPVVYGTYSATTLRHIKDWLRQNGFKADSSKQIMADYGAKDESLTEKRDSKEVKDSPFGYERRLLARLKSDCDYTLGACKDNGSSFEGVQKHFWAGNSGNQIAKMRELHQLSKDMDDIVTDSDIDTYEKRFRDWSKQEALTEASDGKSVENEFKNYRAFAANFSPVTIKKNGKQYYVFKKGDEDGEHWIQYGSKDYIDGWLYGAVQAKMKIVESAKSKGGKKNLKEGLSYGEMAAIEDEWAKYKERHGIKGFADADVALAFIEEECAEVYPTQDEQDEIFTHIGLIEEGGEYDESLKEGNKPLKESDDVVVFTQEPDDWYGVDFEDWIGDYPWEDGIVIYGNRHFQEYGKDELISIVKGEYEDDSLWNEEDGYYEDYDVLEMLKKVTGKEYEEGTLRGYSQGDWQGIYYPVGTDEKELEYIEDLYMGKYKGFVDPDNSLHVVPDSICWQGTDAIKAELSDQSGVPVEDIRIRKFKGYTRTPSYEQDESLKK